MFSQLLRTVLPVVFSLFTWMAAAYNGTPGQPLHNGPATDSLARTLGHCKTVIVVDTICSTHQITLSAFIDWTWTGVHQPVQAQWNNGLNAHKIVVDPPGTWSWDPLGTSCEPWHWYNEVTFDYPFFQDSVDITGPTALCADESSIDLNLNTDSYSYFASIDWSPASPTGDINPYQVVQPGNYSVTVTDAMGCTSSDQINVASVPHFTPAVTGPNRLCPEGDTGVVALTNPGLYSGFEWGNGETTSSFAIYQPGIYDVTVTESHGCTGVNAVNVQSGEVGIFDISQSSPALCPGALDTLRVVGGYTQYHWSNNVSGITNVVAQAGTYTVTVTNTFGCTGTSSAVVSPLLPPPLSIQQSPLCVGDTATLTAAGAPVGQFIWSTGQTTSSIQVTAPGTYSVSVSGAGVCATSTSTVADYATMPDAQIAPPGVLTCVTLLDTLDATASSNGPGFQFLWTSPNGHFYDADSTLNPVVDVPGDYIIGITNQLTGCTSYDTVQVPQQIALPDADGGPNDTLTCVDVQFALQPIVPTNPQWLPLWSSPNGNILSGADSWAPQVDAPGEYVLQVTDATNGCVQYDTVLVDMDVAQPQVQIAPTDLLTCTQGTVLLDGNGSSAGADFTYQWSTANGNIAGAANMLTANATAAGMYQLIVTNTANGCTASATIPVTADVNIPVPVIAAPDTLDCLNINMMLNGAGSSGGPTYSYAWSTANGHIVSGGNTLTPLVDVPGIYTLSVVNTANNCTSTLSVTVPQNIQAPAADAGVDTLLNCYFPVISLDGAASAGGTQFSYQWSSTDGNILSGADSLSPTVDQAGTYLIVVTDHQNGCTSTASVQVSDQIIAPNVAIAAPADLTCVQLQSTLDAGASAQGSHITYQWSGGNILGGQDSIVATVNAPGVYNLLITNTINGCTAQSAVTVEQNLLVPPIEAGPDMLLNCYTVGAALGAIWNPDFYPLVLSWTSAGGVPISPNNTPTIIVTQPDTYQLQVTNVENGCTATDIVVVNSDYTAPAADAGATFELNCVQNSTVLTGSGSTGNGFTYQWTTTGGHIASGAQTLNPVVDAPGDYQLLVTNTQNGCTSGSLVTITENADGPQAVAIAPQQLTCVHTSTLIDAGASSTGPEYSYAWNTSDGHIVSGNNTLQLLVDEPGAYTLTVTNSSNLCTETLSVTVPQNIQSPEINAGADDVLTCLDVALSLQADVMASASNNITYQWTGDNGQIISGAQSANPVINMPGTYTLTITDQFNGCTDTDALVISQDVALPVAQIVQPQILTCSVQQVTLSSAGSSTGPAFQYLWTTANGHLLSAPNAPSPQADAPGLYNLLITNTVNGCVQTASISVAQDTAAPTAQAGNSITLDCDTPTGNLNGNGSSQGPEFVYQWKTTDGQLLSGLNTLMPLTGAPGQYEIIVLNTQNGCTGTDMVQVLEDVVLPVPLVAPPQVLTCAQASVSLSANGTQTGPAPLWSWTTVNGNILSGSNSAQSVVDEPGQYQVMVTNTQNGCSATLNVTVQQDITPPPVQIQPAPLLTCSLTQLNLNATAPPSAVLQWTTGNGQIVSGANTLQPLVNAPGTYQLQVVSAQNGCSNSAQVQVQEETNVPTGFDFTLQPPICDGTPGVVSVQQVAGGVGPYAYSLDGGENFFASAAFNTVAPGNYELVIQDVNGCEWLETVDVPEPPLPAVDAPLAFQLELGQQQDILAVVPSTFPLSLVDRVVWTPMEGLTFAGTTVEDMLHPIAQPFHTTEYTVTIYSAEGCSATARTLVNVHRTVNVYAPNIITPDDPLGENNRFTLFARDEAIALIHQLQVYDRWGALLFEQRGFRPNNPDAGWDGTYKGEPLNPAVFVWWAEVELIDGRKLLLKGDVTVAR